MGKKGKHDVLGGTKYPCDVCHEPTPHRALKISAAHKVGKCYKRMAKDKWDGKDPEKLEDQ